MNRDDSSATPIEAAEVYEELFVPALFGWWAQEVSSTVALRPGDRVLDVACGTGVLARAAAELVGPQGEVVGLDPDEGMLAVAARHAPNIDWRVGAAESLPFDAGMFDAVVSQFGLMFFSDPLNALREARRVLRPSGRTVFAVWASLEETPAYAAFVRLLEQLFGRSVADGLRAPFAMGDRGTLSSLFRDAGFGSRRVVTRTGSARFSSLEEWIEADAKGWLQLDESQNRRLLDAARAELDAFVTSDGAVEFAMAAHIAYGDR